MASKSQLFTNQEAMTMDQTFRTALNTRVAYVDQAPDVNTLPKATANSVPAEPHQVLESQRGPICTKAGVQRGPVGATKIGGTNWLLYWKHGNPKTLLMIGQYGSQSGAIQLQDWFAWSPTVEQANILNGGWEAPEGVDNAVNMASTTPLIYAHNDKHFGAKPDEAQFTIGTVPRRKPIVAGMEAKAVEHGMMLAGEAFFRFDRVVGTDGQKPQKNSMSIRVDTAGGPTQHSHPIPENEDGMVSHDSKVKTAIRTHTVTRNLGELVAVAKYLTLIGTPHGTYSSLKSNVGLYGASRPPACVFWEW